MHYEILGYVFLLFSGFSLGLLGGGGSVLVVPILVYLFKMDIVEATALSLLVVGSSTLRAGFSYVRARQFSIKALLLFGTASLIGVVLSRAVFMPNIPHEITVFSYSFEKRSLVMVVFAGTMVAAAYAMLKKTESQVSAKCIGRCIHLKMIIHGLLIGAIAGFVGAGGGFLIIPSLVYLLALPMRKAIGTSLALVTIQSFVGFFTGQSLSDVNCGFAGLVLLVVMFGVQLGLLLSKRVTPIKLKRWFGYLILVIALIITGLEFLK